MEGREGHGLRGSECGRECLLRSVQGCVGPQGPWRKAEAPKGFEERLFERPKRLENMVKGIRAMGLRQSGKSPN